jgi:hypothetical protein
MTVYYEDLFPRDRPLEGWKLVLPKILDFLDIYYDDSHLVAAQRHFTSSRKWASRELYADLPHIRDLDEKVGSEAIGWLFR